MKKVIRLTESDLTRIVKRVIGEEEKQNLFPDAPTSASNDSTFSFNSLRDGYYQAYPTNTLPHEVYKYISNFNSDDREDIWEHIYKRTFIEASGEFNRIHFREGIHPFLQGLGMGYIIYEDFIKFLGYASSTDSATEDSKRVWKKLINDPDFYGVYCNNGDVLAVYKNWDGDVPSLIKSFIRGRNNVSFISDNLLSDYPELNDVMKLSETDITRIVKRVIKEDDEDLKFYNDLINQGVNPLKAYFINQLESGWSNIINGGDAESAFQVLFDGDPKKFSDFAMGNSEDEIIKKNYPKWDAPHIIHILWVVKNLFLNGDKNKTKEFFKNYFIDSINDVNEELNKLESNFDRNSFKSLIKKYKGIEKELTDLGKDLPDYTKDVLNDLSQLGKRIGKILKGDIVDN